MNDKEARMTLTEDQKTALRAFAQWHWGDASWAGQLTEILEADDPLAAVPNICHGHSAAWILEREGDG